MACIVCGLPVVRDFTQLRNGDLVHEECKSARGSDKAQARKGPILIGIGGYQKPSVKRISDRY